MTAGALPRRADDVAVVSLQMPESLDLQWIDGCLRAADRWPALRVVARPGPSAGAGATLATARRRRHRLARAPRGRASWCSGGAWPDPAGWAGLFLRTVRNAYAVDPGYSVAGVLLAEINLDLRGYAPEAGQDVYRRVLDRLATLPGVRGAGASRVAVLSGGSRTGSVSRDGQPVRPDGSNGVPTRINVVSDSYLAAMGIPLLSGRGFASSDSSTAPRVAIVSQSLAQRLWPGRDPIGLTLTPGPNPTTVIGVVPDVVYRSVIENEPLPFYLLPLSQNYESGVTLHVRGAEDPLALLPGVRQVVREIDPLLVVARPRTLEAEFARSLGPQRLMATFVGIFAGLAAAATFIHILRLQCSAEHGRLRRRKGRASPNGHGNGSTGRNRIGARLCGAPGCRGSSTPRFRRDARRSGDLCDRAGATGGDRGVPHSCPAPCAWTPSSPFEVEGPRRGQFFNGLPRLLALLRRQDLRDLQLQIDPGGKRSRLGVRDLRPQLIDLRGVRRVGEDRRLQLTSQLADLPRR